MAQTQSMGKKKPPLQTAQPNNSGKKKPNITPALVPKILPNTQQGPAGKPSFVGDQAGGVYNAPAPQQGYQPATSQAPGAGRPTFGYNQTVSRNDLTLGGTLAVPLPGPEWSPQFNNVGTPDNPLGLPLLDKNVPPGGGTLFNAPPPTDQKPPSGQKYMGSLGLVNQDITTVEQHKYELQVTSGARSFASDLYRFGQTGNRADLPLNISDEVAQWLFQNHGIEFFGSDAGDWSTIMDSLGYANVGGKWQRRDPATVVGGGGGYVDDSGGGYGGGYGGYTRGGDGYSSAPNLGMITWRISP